MIFFAVKLIVSEERNVCDEDVEAVYSKVQEYALQSYDFRLKKMV